MVQHLINEDLQGSGLADVQGFTFGSIGAEVAPANKQIANFGHVNDPAIIAPFLPGNTVGGHVAIKSPIAQYSFADVVLEQFDIIKPHSMDTYVLSTGQLVAEAYDEGGLFYDSLLAEELRGAGDVSFRYDIVLGREGADKLVASRLDEFVLAGNGSDVIDMKGRGASERVIDGGLDADKVVMEGSRSDYQIAADDADTFTVSYSGDKTAILDRVETLVFPRWLLDAEDPVEPNALAVAAASVELDGPVVHLDGTPTSVQTPGTGSAEFLVDPTFDYADAGDGDFDVLGSAQGDVIVYGTGDKTIRAGTGDDIVISKVVSGLSTGGLVDPAVGQTVAVLGAGDDLLFGGDGEETVSLSGQRADYAVAGLVDGTVVIRDGRDGSPDGTDSLLGVEFVQFADGTYTVEELLPSDPPVISSDGGGDTAAVSIAENTTAVTTVAASDPNAGDTLAYSKLGGADEDLFTIDAATGALAFISAPDFETPADADGNNDYEVQVQVADGNGGFDTQTLLVTVTNANDTAPAFTSGTTATFAENATSTVYDANAGDADNLGALTYMLSGTDAGLFDIDASTGVVTFQNAPDFENPLDQGANNVYDITVTASDGTLSTGQAAAITVTDVAETAPNLTDVFGSQMSVTTSSLYGSAYGGSKLLDDNTGSSVVTQNGADEWIKLDLGGNFDITSLSLTNRNAAGQRLDGAVVQLRDALGNVVHTFDPISGATNGEVFNLSLDQAVTAASVYIDGTAGQYLQVAELDVFGFESAVPGPANVTDVFGSQMSVTTSSLYGSAYGGSNLLDDNTGSSVVTQNGADEWIKLDLGGNFDITSLSLTNRNAAGQRLDGAVVQLRDALGNVVHTFDPISGATNGEVFNLSLDQAVTAASVYIDGTAGQYLQVAELDVFGFESAVPGPANVTDAFGSQMSVTTSSLYGSAYGGSKLLDDNTGSSVVTQNGADEWIKLDLGGNFDITSLSLTNRNAAGQRLDGAVVQLRDALGNVVHTFDPISGATNGEVFNLSLDQAVTAASVYIDGTAGQYLQVAELDVFGFESAVPGPANVTDAFGSQMSVTTSSLYGSAYGGSKLLDDNTGSSVVTQNGADEWIKLDLGGNFDITSLSLTNRNAAGQRLDGAVVQLRDALGNVVHTFDPISGATNGEVFNLSLDQAVTAASVYIDGTAGQYLQVAELDVFGFESDPSEPDATAAPDDLVLTA
ncbi:discoidin domain-containing protein [Mesorhizobium sp. L-2-11]|uniref:discoidin domain-containing protein n=1 Tax=Mesorhizobium sp. L-2-11 TaxID=2744521 RepID=UPI001927A248|nr:discoidin domain-containing protein [Mesorhizobium sp. L-2-11]